MAPYPFKPKKRLVPTGAAGTAASASGFPKVKIGIKMKTHAGKINFYCFRFPHKFFIHNKFKTFYVKNIICIFWLVQSHGK
jgi:hypothetical protein